MITTNATKTYTKALVLGTGGGNDIVSAIIIALKLQKQGIQCDIAGVLSPAAVHSFGGQEEQVVNIVQQDLRRYLHNKKHKEISFIDGKLPAIAQVAGVNIGTIYDFSLRYGMDKLIRGVNDLIQEKKYDLFVEVDVGGDILARGYKDTTLLSPLMDFASLHLMKQVTTDSLLVEFGLGTDGELRPDGMREILSELDEKGLLLGQSTISQEDTEVQKFKETYDKIKETRSGHTATITLETLKHIGEKEDYQTLYRFISQIGNTKVRHEFNVTIPHESFGQVYTVQGKAFAEERGKTAFAFENLLEQYIRLKTMQPQWKTEADLLYLRSGDNWTTPHQEGYCLQLLAPSKMITQAGRKSLIDTGIDMLVKGETDLSIILREDKNMLNFDDILIHDAGKFSILYTNPESASFIEKTAQQLMDYQTIQ